MRKIPNAALEAETFARYLIGRSAPTDVLERYERYLGTQGDAPGPRDERLLRFALDNPRLLGFVDAGCALVEPESALRSRLFAMAALLETSIETCQEFIPVNVSRWHAASVAHSGIRAVLRAAAGALLVEIVACRK